MKIYTKAGDEGYTTLGTGGAVHKGDSRVEAYGTIDELSSFVGLALSRLPRDMDPGADLLWIQRKLFEIGSILAFPGQNSPKDLGQITPECLHHLELAIDDMSDLLPPLASFILPGGRPEAALLHCARSICRRAERIISTLEPAEYPLGTNILPFLNRLSDYLFCAARLVNHQGGQSEFPAKG